MGSRRASSGRRRRCPAPVPTVCSRARCLLIDREVLHHLSDAGLIAHRRGIVEARFAFFWILRADVGRWGLIGLCAGETGDLGSSAVVSPHAANVNAMPAAARKDQIRRLLEPTRLMSRRTRVSRLCRTADRCV